MGTGNPLGYTHTNTAPRHFYRLREGAMRPGFDEVEYGRNDDLTYPKTDEFPTLPPTPVPIGFGVHFFGETYTQCYVNNNGNITFTGAYGKYTPEDLGTQEQVMIAPFWADVDTRNAASGLTRFSQYPGVANGRPAFGVTWRGVGYFNTQIEKDNSFQLLLINRSDVTPGDFDIEFNYNQIQWETGKASGGTGGLGGYPARVGWANGSGRFMEYKGSGETLAFLDKKPGQSTPNYADGLKYQMWNSSVPGRIVIPVRDGIPGGAPGYDFQADAGADQLIYPYLPNTFVLYGAITPPETTGVAYHWEQVQGPELSNTVIEDSTSLQTSVSISEPGVYIFKLTATKQGDFLSVSSDYVEVKHMDKIRVESGGPYTSYWSSGTIPRLYGAVATYNGFGINDVEWEQIEGEAVTISDTHAICPDIYPPGPGEYRFRLTARTAGAAQWVRTSETTLTVFE